MQKQTDMSKAGTGREFRNGLMTLAIVAMCTLVATAHGAVVIADFDDSTSGDVSKASLDAGSPGGSWTINHALGQNGTLTNYTDDANDNHLFLDGPRDDSPFDYDLDFDSAVPLGPGASVSMDLLLRRAAVDEEWAQRDPVITASDADGDVLWQLYMKGVNTADSGTVGLIGHGLSSEQINFLGASSQASTTDMMTVEVLLGSSTFDVLVGGTTAFSGISYDNAVTDLSALKFTAQGSNADYAGLTVDNVMVTIPEPASVVLMAMGVLLALRRR